MKIKIFLVLFLLLFLSFYLFEFFKQNPAVVVTKKTPIFLSSNKDKLWSTEESVKRISTKFSSDKVSKTFTTVDNVLHAYKGWEHDDAAYSSAYTKNEYSNYVLDLEFKWGEGKYNPRKTKPRDAGIIFHVYGNTNTPWPSGMEYQLKEPNQYGGLVTVRTRALVSQNKGVYDGASPETLLGKKKGAKHLDIDTSGVPIYPDWNKARLEIRGDSGVYYLNGKKVMQYTKAEYFHKFLRQWRPLTQGRILLQAEGAEIQYRNIFLKPISAPK